MIIFVKNIDMKKILAVIFLFATVAVSAQTFPEDLDTLIGSYIYQRDEGNIPEAEQLAYELLIKLGSYAVMHGGTGEGETVAAASAHSRLNTRLGTSYSLPTFTYDETTQSYLTLDSIKIPSAGDYINYLMTWTEVKDTISTYNILTASDTAWIQSDISDSSQAAIVTANAYTDVQVAATISDSTYESLTTDTVFVSNASAAIYSDGSYYLNFMSGGVEALSIDEYVIESGQAQGVQFPNVGTNDVRVVLNKTDDNTGITWLSADKGELQAGDSAIAYFYEVGAKEVFEVVDSLINNGRSNFLDSVYLDYASDTEADEQWVGLSATMGMFGDSISAASHGMTDPLIPLKKYLSDTINGELLWVYANKWTGERIVTRGVSKNLGKAVNQIVAQQENTLRRQRELEKQINNLRIGFGACVIAIFLLLMAIFYKQWTSKT